LEEKIGFLQKVWQNGVFFKNTANGGQTAAKRRPNVGKNDGRGKRQQTAAKRRPNVDKNDGRGKQLQNGCGVFFKNTANGGQTAAKMTTKMTAVENGGKMAAKKRPNGGPLHFTPSEPGRQCLLAVIQNGIR
jgi:hypothetical protein